MFYFECKVCAQLFREFAFVIRKENQKFGLNATFSIIVIKVYRFKVNVS